MKTINATVMLLALTLFTGCYKQDYSICAVEENCVLLFELEASMGGGEFTSRISTIDVALFNGSGELREHVQVEEAALREFQGVRFTVDPGKYYVVAWGNVSECSRLSTHNGVPATPLADSYLKTVSDATGCNLYYAPTKPIETLTPGSPVSDWSLYEVDVKANEVTRKQLVFTRANRRVNIYLKDFKQTPEVRLTNIPDSYDYFLRTQATRKNFRQGTSNVVYEPTGDRMELASFRAPIVPFESPMTVDVVTEGTRAEQMIKTFNLKDWVEANESKITDMNEINILLTQGIDGSVSIEVANWKDDDVKPSW